MSDQQCGPMEQGGQDGTGQRTGYGEPGQGPGAMAGEGAGPSGQGQGQGQFGAGQPAESGRQAAGSGPFEQGQAPQGAMSGGQPGPNPHTGYAAPPSGYAYGDPQAAMAHASHMQPGMDARQQPYYGAAYQAPPPNAGYYAPPAGIYPQYGPAPVYSGAAQPGPAGGGTAHTQSGQGRQAGMSQLMEEVSNGGSGFSSLGKMLDLDDSEFWKGALIGAAAVLLLTNESVQNMLFKTGAKAKDAVQSGVAKVKERASEAAEQAKETQE